MKKKFKHKVKFTEVRKEFPQQSLFTGIRQYIWFKWFFWKHRNYDPNHYIELKK